MNPVWNSLPNFGNLARYLRKFHQSNQSLTTIFLNHDPIEKTWQLSVDEKANGRKYGQEMVPPYTHRFDHTGAARRIMADVLRDARS